MSYENPQRIVNRTWEVFAKMTQQNNNRIASNMQAGLNSFLKNRASNKAATQKIENDKLNFAAKIDSIDASKSGKDFTKNLGMFYDSNIDKYYNVKNAMQKGEIDKREGNRILAAMDSQVDKMKVMMPKILDIATQVWEGSSTAGKQGGISTSTTPANIINVFGAIAEGGNVYTVEDPKSDNVWFMKLPEDVEKKFLADGTIDEYELQASLNDQLAGAGDQEQYGGGLVNMDEIMKLGPENMVKRITNLDAFSEPLMKTVLKEEDINNGYYSLNQTYELNGDTSVEKTGIYTDVAGANKMKTALEDVNAYTSMLNDNEAMQSIWGDLMPDELTNKLGFKWDGSDDQRTAARGWMIEDGIAKMLLRQGLIEGEEVDGVMVPKIDPNATGDLLNRLTYLQKEQTGFVDIQNVNLGELNKTEKADIQTSMQVVEPAYGKIMNNWKTWKDNNSTASTEDRQKAFANTIIEQLNSLPGPKVENTWMINPDNPKQIMDGKRGTPIDLVDKSNNPREDVIIQLLGTRSGLGSKTAAKLFKNFDKYKQETDSTDIDLSFLPEASSSTKNIG